MRPRSTLGEYYRQMGLNVLLIADSTLRWTQAMRENSGRLEEIPGEEGSPAYLDSSIKTAYERAGVLQTNDRSIGRSDNDRHRLAGRRHFDEPVTQSTLPRSKPFWDCHRRGRGCRHERSEAATARRPNRNTVDGGVTASIGLQSAGLSIQVCLRRFTTCRSHFRPPTAHPADPPDRQCAHPSPDEFGS